MVAVISVAGCATAPSGPEVVTVEVGDETVRVWVADTPEERGQGLRGVSGLPRGVDGMLFVWDEPGQRVFTMEDTLMPLDIWWFDSEMRLLHVDSVRPCERSPCPIYPSPGPVLWVLETPAGEWAFAAGAKLSNR